MDSYHFKHIICNLYVQKIYIFWFPRAGDFVLKNSHYNTKNTPKNCWFHFDFSQRRNHPKIYLFLTCCTLEKYLAFHDGFRHFDSCVSVRCNEMYFLFPTNKVPRKFQFGIYIIDNSIRVRCSLAHYIFECNI